MQWNGNTGQLLDLDFSGKYLLICERISRNIRECFSEEEALIEQVEMR
jgi:hypothetical protein